MHVENSDNIQNILNNSIGKGGIIEVENATGLITSRIVGVYVLEAPAAFTADIDLDPVPAGTLSSIGRSFSATGMYYDNVPLKNFIAVTGKFEVQLK